MALAQFRYDGIEKLSGPGVLFAAKARMADYTKRSKSGCHHDRSPNSGVVRYLANL
jgi:hypothetical protein